MAADSPGFTVTGTWDPVGMRGTVSRSLVLDDVFVPEDRAVMPQGAYYRAAVDWPHIYMTISATYMGITEAALDFTVRYLRGEVPGGPEAQRSSTSKQLAVAQMRVKVEAARALWERAIAEAGFRPSRDARMRARSPPTNCVTETANEVAEPGPAHLRGRAIARAFPLERYYRDSRCGSLMLPWTAEICLERLGHGTLYEAGEPRLSSARAAAPASAHPELERAQAGDRRRPGHVEHGRGTRPAVPQNSSEPHGVQNSSTNSTSHPHWRTGPAAAGSGATGTARPLRNRRGRARAAG